MRTTNNSLVLPSLAGAIVAMIIAGMMDMRFGDIIFAGLLGAVAVQLWRLRQQLEELEEHVINLDQQKTPTLPSVSVSRTASSPAVSTSVSAASTPPAATSSVGNPRQDTSSELQPGATTRTAGTHTASPPSSPSNADLAQQPARVAAKRVYVPPPPSAVELQLRAFGNWLKTRNPIALAAVAISFLGGVFLVKYAAEHSHFPIEYRFIALSAVTIGAVMFGWRVHARNNAHQVFAQIVQGGGIAGLYLTVFAATRLYALLPAQLAFVLMVGIAVAAALLAVAQNAMSLAIIGTAGGFLTPILVSTGSNNHIALFTYYAILNLGVFTVAWFRTWRVLNVLSFAFTFSITALWRGDAYHQEDWWSTDLFLLLYFLTFAGISVLNALRQPPNLKGYVSGSLVFGLPVAAFSLHASLVHVFPYALAYSAFGLAVFYCALAWTLHRQANANFRLLVEAFAALAVIFASLAIPLAFNRQATAAMWSFEGAGMIWLGLRTQRKLPRFFGVLLQVSAGWSYLHAVIFPRNATALLPVINGEYLGSVLLCGTAWFSARLLHRHEDKHTDQPLASYERSWAVIALWAGCAWWLFGGMNEIHARLHEVRIAAVLVHASLGAFILWFAAQRWSWRLPATMALCAPGLGALLALMQLAHVNDLSHPFMHGGILGWPVVFATQYALLWLHDKKTHADTPVSLCNALHVINYLALTFIISWEGYWQAGHHLAGVWPALVTGVVPALMLWSLAHVPGQSMLVDRWPVAQHSNAYRIQAAMVLTAFIQLWLLVVNVTNAGDPAYLVYLPLLNPLDVTSLLLFTTVIKWWRSLDNKQQQAVWPSTTVKPLVIIALLCFIWMNAAVIRTLHYEFSVPLSMDSLFESTLVQTTLSIFWMLLALILMLHASRRKLRVLWLTGAILMALVIAKLLLVDLAHTGTLARIISFLTVGGLLFVVSYLSPLPPSSNAEQSAE